MSAAAAGDFIDLAGCYPRFSEAIANRTNRKIPGVLPSTEAFLGGGQTSNFTEPAFRPLQLCRERWPNVLGASVEAIRDFAKPTDLGVKRAGLSSARSRPNLFQPGYHLVCFVKTLADPINAIHRPGHFGSRRRERFYRNHADGICGACEQTMNIVCIIRV